MDSVQWQNETDYSAQMRVVCGWCGKLLRDAGAPHLPTSHGICVNCSRVLEGGGMNNNTGHSSDISALERHTNVLMCRLYENRQMLLDLQHRVSHDAELLARVGQMLASIRQQERVIGDIQQWILSAQD
jgi:hypothetical protein